ncbi:MAG: hypothetical protein HS108_08915 [Planctomycetes bacterium]|jgi:hypothetical protein|nr:hypothetical protein [Planctomycetota bacterium]MCL4730755.1 hypothetical protein [Planctomycetota bacterium]
MDGILVGAILGMAAVCFGGAWRSWHNWKSARPQARPARGLALVVVGLQVALGVGAALLGLFFLLGGMA